MKVDITPRGECDLNGFIGRKQPSLGVKAAVMARVLALECGRWRGLIAVCDLLGFSPEDSMRIEAAMAEAARVPVRNVLLACTHTHSAPVSMPLGTVGRYRRGYVDRIEHALARAARLAREDADAVTNARFGRADCAERGRFRCATDEPGRHHWAGKVSVLRVERETRPPITAVHVPIHPYVLGPRNRYVHPDYPGALCDRLERLTRDCAIVLPGCGADIHPVPAATNSLGAVARFARELASNVLGAVEHGRQVSLEPVHSTIVAPLIRYGFLPPELASDGKEVAMRVRRTQDPRLGRNMREWRRGLRDGSCRRSFRFRTHLMRLGDLLLVGLPAEVFWDTGEDLGRTLTGERTLVLAQAGGDVGYLPRPFAYTHLTYEAASAHQWYRTAGAVVPGTEERVRKAVVRAALRLLED
jgi:neutral ceramidase